MANRRHGIRPRVRVGTIRARMIRILALSLASVLIPLGFLIVGDVRGYSAALDTSRAVTTVQDIQALIHELQKERGLSVGLLSAAGVRAALKNLDSLSVTRGAVDRAGVLRYYTGAIAALSTLDVGAGTTADPALHDGLAALAQFARSATAAQRACGRA